MTDENSLGEEIKVILTDAGYEEIPPHRTSLAGFRAHQYYGHPEHREIVFRHYRSPTHDAERASFYATVFPLLEAKYGSRVTRRYEDTLLVALIVAPA
ncbi:MAG TPA: hypothetical protein VM581_03940 [Magnetospirillaceae bacterium]|nr:hypothetical protein [Magnetospirillaceae bacterium]